MKLLLLTKSLFEVITVMLLLLNMKVGMKMSNKEKMLEIIKKKQGGGRSKQMAEPRNDAKNMRKGPKIFNK
jgi:hypothetical protein